MAIKNSLTSVGVLTNSLLPCRSNWLSVAGDAALLVVGGTNLAAGLIYRGDWEYIKLIKVRINILTEKYC